MVGPLARRRLLLQAAAIAGGALVPQAWTPALAQARLGEDPFQLGVASGDPTADGVVLWTRLAPRPLSPDGGMAPAPAAVDWVIAEDEALTRVAARGQTLAVAEAGHSVHVEVSGLRPDRVYFYRFYAGGHASPTGRTRTAPLAGADVARLRIAYGSCQKYEAGYYPAYAHMVADAPDLVLFLGDYIYEGDATDKGVRRHPGPEPMDLAGYRVRYGAYKSDPQLQAAHAAAPWMVIWDDHEVENDYGGDQSQDDVDPALFLRRRAAAYQAYYEHMPLRRAALPVGPQMQLYRALTWGRLAEIQLLDDRQHRPHRTCQAQANGKLIPDCDERRDPTRSLLGPEQEAWLMERLASTQGHWNLLAQQTLMGEGVIPGPLWSNDGWDGYPATRNRILEQWRRAQVSNPVVLGGDIHTFVAGDLKLDPEGPVIASEFVGGSISSLGRSNAAMALLQSANPHLKFGDGEVRGYGLVDLTRETCAVRFRAVESALVPQSPIRNLAAFVVEDGERGLKPA
ncbi:MAG: alkaline phosphatase D family protein [Phenylobacterium sp.]|uniref:alkaline phosphatase D family protein n=1 Tax=Phenylobacterium sp. TaxID=1871053 RepID=UPI0017E0F553|nr:alkaline phosphatase D family protein [Phenylobacterium sp.]MBA4794591.1 alkaline phosphatase D family protein [Phenylobacterium sp.]